MKRRTMLKGVAAALATAPAWVQRAFADEECSANGAPKAPGNAMAALATAFRAAQRGGRPLLVLVIPENPQQRWARGAAFGEWINHATADQLRPLALVEVACARMKLVRRLVPSAPEGEPVMLLVETYQSPALVQALKVELTRYTGERELDDLDGSPVLDSRAARKKREEDAIDQRIAALSEALRTATLGDPASTARRQTQNDLALSAAERARLLAADVSAFEPAFVERAAPLLMAQATSALPRAVKLRALLDEVVATKVKRKPPLGARWASTAGCGVEIEGETSEMMVGCGMGHTPERSQRFLYFFAGQANDEKPDEE